MYTIEVAKVIHSIQKIHKQIDLLKQNSQHERSVLK